MTFSRRQILRALIAAGVAMPFRASFAQMDSSNVDKYCVFIQVRGGWDPTSFCDPKLNQPGEPAINHWAEAGEIERAGNIAYAPFANNQTFFEKYHQRMLVINGVDSQTNSHRVGIVNTWTGRVAEGHPTATALYAAASSRELALPYIAYDGYSQTAGLTNVTHIHGDHVLANIGYPNQRIWRREKSLVPDSDMHALREFSNRTAMDRLNESSLGQEREQISNYLNALKESDELQRLSDEFSRRGPLSSVQEMTSSSGTTYYSTLRRQSEVALLAFKSGVSVSADLQFGGFDTHEKHDADHATALELLTDGIDHLWEFAEQQNIADQLFVVVASDFGRTNQYNATEGKDHWPISSYLIMEKNQEWTDRAIGSTDELHFARRLNPASLESDPVRGSVLYPRHVHRAIRRYLGIDQSAGALRYPLHASEDFDFFEV